MPAPDLESLVCPLPAWHPKAWFYGAARLLMRTVGRLSHGIRIGLAHGFDSGVMLDHVYQNRPRGTGWLGRVLDRVYLDAPGWAGIRHRGALVEDKIVKTLRELGRDGARVRIADLACGGGRYLLNALMRVRGRVAVTATLRDYRRANVEKAAQGAAGLGVDATVEEAQR